MFGKKRPDTALRNKEKIGIKRPDLSEENRKRTGKNHPCYGMKRPDLAERNRQRKGEKRSDETREKMSESKMGENHPMFGKRGAETYNWKNGISVLYDRIRACFLYRQWRSDVYTRDNFICQKCNKRGLRLHVHHITFFSDIIKLNNITTLEQAEDCSELWNINNGLTLCIKCHKAEHKRMRNDEQSN